MKTSHAYFTTKQTFVLYIFFLGSKNAKIIIKSQSIDQLWYSDKAIIILKL